VSNAGYIRSIIVVEAALLAVHKRL
jgi:hypothetical protein